MNSHERYFQSLHELKIGVKHHYFLQILLNCIFIKTRATDYVKINCVILIEVRSVSTIERVKTHAQHGKQEHLG